MRKVELKKGDKVRAVRCWGPDITVGMVYTVTAGAGDKDMGIGSSIGDPPLVRDEFNFADDAGDIRYSALTEVGEVWEVLPNE